MSFLIFKEFYLKYNFDKIFLLFTLLFLYTFFYKNVKYIYLYIYIYIYIYVQYLVLYQLFPEYTINQCNRLSWSLSHSS